MIEQRIASLHKTDFPINGLDTGGRLYGIEEQDIVERIGKHGFPIFRDMEYLIWRVVALPDEIALKTGKRPHMIDLYRLLLKIIDESRETMAAQNPHYAGGGAGIDEDGMTV